MRSIYMGKNQQMLFHERSKMQISFVLIVFTQCTLDFDIWVKILWKDPQEIIENWCSFREKHQKIRIRIKENFDFFSNKIIKYAYICI